MSVALRSIQNQYMQNFPSQVPTKAAQGFIVTTVINLVKGATGSMALLGGAIAVTATLIEAVTRPIITAVFPKHPTIARCIQIITSTMIALGLAASLAPWIGVVYKTTSIVMPLLAMLLLNDGFYEKNEALVQVF